MKKAGSLEQTLDVIRQALEASGVHVFGELLHMPNVQAVSLKQKNKQRKFFSIEKFFFF